MTSRVSIPFHRHALVIDITYHDQASRLAVFYCKRRRYGGGLLDRGPWGHGPSSWSWQMHVILASLQGASQHVSGVVASPLCKTAAVPFSDTGLSLGNQHHSGITCIRLNCSFQCREFPSMGDPVVHGGGSI